jgi:excisionase family DNA binding protein
LEFLTKIGKGHHVRYFNVQQVAEQLAVAPTTVYALCQQKLIPHVRVGTGRGAIRISEEGLAQYLAGASVQPAVPAAPKPPPVKLKHLKP